MNERNIIDLFLGIKTWKGDGGRAPHKPLLLLLVLGQLLRGKTKFYYQEIEEQLSALLQDFGPPRSVYHSNYPFWRLQKDKIWRVITSELVQENNRGDVGVNALRKTDAYGHFTAPIQTVLRKQPELVKKLVKLLLEKNFSETIHEDILQAIGLDLLELHPTKRKRLATFRESVLRAYEYRCAVCGFDVRLGHSPIALEAAHIKWHQAGGPDTEVNGLALCALHHKLFDRGAFTLADNHVIRVSDRVNGTQGFAEWLMQYNGVRITVPLSSRYTPAEDFLCWHTKEIFQGEFREQ